MKQLFVEFWRGEQDGAPDDAGRPEDDRRRQSERGQSLVEYCILLTWTCLAMMAMINAAGGDTKRVWTVANQDLVTANASAS